MKLHTKIALISVFGGAALGSYMLFGPAEQDASRPTYLTDPNAALRERCVSHSGQMAENQAYRCAIAVWDRVHYTALKTAADLSSDRAMKRECFYHFTLPSYPSATDGARDLFRRAVSCLRETSRVAGEARDFSHAANTARRMVAEAERDITGHLAQVPHRYR